MDFSKNKAIFLQIADMLSDSILNDKWVAGDRMPSIRETAIVMEVNPNTVIRTYTYLQENEIIFNRRGLGYFVSPAAKEKIIMIKRERFVKIELPNLVTTMRMLGIEFEDLRDLFERSAG
jgi:DNA-binding transcriptional regulator YhcF (GntR family)